MWHHVVFFTMNPHEHSLAWLSLVLSLTKRTFSLSSVICSLPFSYSWNPKVWSGQKQSLISVYQFSLAASSETASCWLTQHGPRITPTLKISLSHPLSLPSLYVREERDGPYERSGKRTFTIYNESESSTLFPVSETCCYDVSSSHESLWCPWHRRTHSDARKRNIITAQNRWEV